MTDIVKTFDPATGLETWKEVSTGSAGFLSRKFYTETLSAAANFVDVPIGSMQFTTRAAIDVYLNGDHQDNVTVPQAQRITPSEPFQAGDVVAVVSYRTVVEDPEPVVTFKKIELDVGAEFVGEASFTVTDPSVIPESLVVASVVGLAPSDGRDVDEIYLERVSVLARPLSGSVRLDLIPHEGDFSGRFVVAYSVS